MKLGPRMAGAIVVGLIVLAVGALAVWRSLGRAYWVPSPTSTFQVKLASPFDPTSQTDLGVDEFTYLGTAAPAPTVYDIDGNSNTSATVDALHQRGAHVICFVPVAYWSPTMYDAQDPAWAQLEGAALPNGDRWLDTDPTGPHYALLIDLETELLQNCHDNDFDAVQADGLDEPAQDVSFGGVPLTEDRFLQYLLQLSDIAHSLGLSLGQSNDLPQSAILEHYFDFLVTVNCFTDRTCGLAAPYEAAHKAVFEIETKALPSAFCPAALAAGRVAGRFDAALDAKLRIPCS